MGWAAARHQQEALYQDRLNECFCCVVYHRRKAQKRGQCVLYWLQSCGSAALTTPVWTVLYRSPTILDEQLPNWMRPLALCTCPVWSSADGLQSTFPVTCSLLLLLQTMWLTAEKFALKTASLTKLLHLRATSHLLSNIHVKDIFNEKNKSPSCIFLASSNFVGYYWSLTPSHQNPPPIGNRRSQWAVPDLCQCQSWWRTGEDTHPYQNTQMCNRTNRHTHTNTGEWREGKEKKTKDSHIHSKIKKSRPANLEAHTESIVSVCHRSETLRSNCDSTSYVS